MKPPKKGFFKGVLGSRLGLSLFRSDSVLASWPALSAQSPEILFRLDAVLSPAGDCVWLGLASRGACADSRPHAVAYDLGGVRPQRARRKLDGARVSARNLPVEPSWSCRRRAPRHGCQPCSRGSRPSSRVPSALSLSASRFRDTHSTRTVQPTGTCRAPATVAARVVWVRVADGTTTALHPGPGKEGPA